MGTSAEPSHRQAMWHHLMTHQQGGALAMFRVLFGLVLSWSALRFLLYGWVEQFFLKPMYFFPFWGFEWIPRPSTPAVYYTVFGVLVVVGLCVSLGLFYRVAIVTAFVLFTWVELLDVTNYLNHYYLVSMLCFWMMLMPLGKHYSIDARRKKQRSWHGSWPRWMTWVIRAQLCVVYFWAGIAKFGSDWLLHAQPMQIWMRSRADLMPQALVGVLTSFEAALVMSWSGFLFDLTIWAFLLWPKSRKWAYVVVLVFHSVTGWLFTIGLFPLIMITSTTLFFEANWPHKLWAKLFPNASALPPEDTPDPPLRQPSKPLMGLITVVLGFQMLFPGRVFLYPGADVLWDEQGMRWAWKVMLREKNGAVTYKVTWQGRQTPLHLSPSKYLTSHQTREMSGQPDMILRLGQQIGRDFIAKGHKGVQVRVDALASLNGRSAQRLIDPELDLMTVRDTLLPARWILPAPSTPPRRIAPSLLSW